jgi:pepF/M3 family oligoendopeptidase
MNHFWDLSTIYPSFDDTKYQSDIEALHKNIQILSEYVFEEDFDETASEYIKQLNLTLSYLYPLATYASLTFSTDTKNETALKYLNKMEEAASLLTEPTVKFTKWLKEYDLSVIKNSRNPMVKEHEFFLTETYKKAVHMLSDKEEVLLSKLQTVGSSAWSSLQGKLTSGLMIEFEVDGEKKPYSLSMIRTFANHQNQDVRKRAYLAELNGYERIEESIAAALNAIKGEVNVISKMRGFDSPLHESAAKAQLDIKSLEAMIEAMKEKLPVFHNYLKRKAELLGHQGPLPFYDLFAPVSESALTYSYDEAKAFVIKHFSAFSQELSDFAKGAFEKNWLDVEPREGKRGGAFCAGIRGRKESRIMLNFDGSFSEVSTMAHELGHGYHNSQVYNETMLNASYPMPVAETASIFCETIITNAALADASKEDAIFILEKSIEGATQVIVDILSRFIFEKNVFDQRVEGPLSVEKLKTTMQDAQKEAYGQGLDSNYLHPYMWICKPHYYSSGFSFYNYPYAFGLLFGKGLYAQYQSGRENFVEDYNKLLNNTTKMDARAVAETMGIDITKKDFWLASLELIEDEINQFLQLTQA